MIVADGANAGLLAWVSDHLGTDFTRVFMTLAVVEADELRGVAVLHNWSKCDIELTYYGPRTLSPSMVRALTEAAVRAGVQRMTVRIHRRDKRMGRGLQALGFRWEGIQRRMYGPTKADDAILYGQIISEAARRYLKEPVRWAA